MERATRMAIVTILLLLLTSMSYVLGANDTATVKTVTIAPVKPIGNASKSDKPAAATTTVPVVKPTQGYVVNPKKSTPLKADIISKDTTISPKADAILLDDETSRPDNVTSIPCRISPSHKDVRKNLSILLERKPKILQYNLTLLNGSLQDDSRTYFKPWYWMRTLGRQGQALLMLPFYYSEMSFGMLSIGEQQLNAEIKDDPPGCLSSLSISDRIDKLRHLLLTDFKEESAVGKLSEREYMCVHRVYVSDGFGSFTPQCCRHGPDSSLICNTLTRGFWINILTIVLSAIKVIIFLFCPLMLPGVFFSARNVLDKYRLNLSKPIGFNVFVTEDKTKKPPPGVPKLTRKSLAAWTQFMAIVEDKKLVPRDTTVQVHVNELNIRMEKKRVISRTQVPVGVITFLYNNFIRCRVRRNPPLTTCCKANLFGKWAPKMVEKFTWINFWLMVTRVFLLVALPFPFYVRLYMYYLYEADEMDQRHEALEIRGLKSSFEGNFVAYLSPIHVLFLVIYIIFIVEGFCIRLLGNDIRNRFKYVLRVSLREMRNVPYSEKIQLGAKILLYPLQTFGCFGLLVGVVYWAVAVPIVALGAVFYFVPMVYLTARVLMSFFKIIGELHDRRAMKPKEANKVNNKLSENHMSDFLPAAGANTSQGDADSDVVRLRKRYLCTEVLMQIFTMACTIATIYATTIIMVECCGFFVELAAFTLMGVIVNAKVTMKYVSLVFLLSIYLYDSYNSVHLTYKALANTIIDNGKSRAKNVDEEASKAESMQENTAFIIHAPEDEEDPPLAPSLTLDQKMPRWLINRPLLFLDTQDFLYVSQKFFEEFCGTFTAGCPGPVYLGLLKATLRFITMVAFLAFVLIVVMVFSDAYSVSTNNQMLATLAGGMLPFMLRNIVFSKKQSLCISAFSFKYLYDDFVRNYQKRWEIFDLEINLGPAPEEEEGAEVGELDENKILAEIVDEHKCDDDDDKHSVAKAATDAAIIAIVVDDVVSSPPPDDDKMTEDATLIDSGYVNADEQDSPIIDLFVDLSINKKQVQIVKPKVDIV